MLLEQLLTSSSSSSSSADTDDQRASPQAQVENPSPSFQHLPQPSAAAPFPEVDEEAQRRLTRILRSMPPEMDAATDYSTLKARMGISLSRDRAITSTSQNPPQNPPSSSQTPTPCHTLTPTPAFPLVQYSGDDSEEEEVQPAAVPTREAESMPPPHAEVTTAPNAPTPPSGGGSNSPTLLGPTQPIEVVDVDDNSTEDLPPPPNEILQKREAEWNFIPHVDDESVPDRE